MTTQDDPELTNALTDAVDADPDVIDREAPNPDEARRKLVSEWADRVRSARQFWADGPFQRMVQDMRFAAGDQWNENPTSSDHVQFNQAQADRYVANMTLRHVQSRTAAIYGKNPKVVARRKERLLNTVWDGNSLSLQTAMQTLQADPMNNMARSVLADAQQSMIEQQRLDKLAKTLELMFEHELDEQPMNFKVQMKATVRRALTTGVGYVKLGFERVMERRPEIDRRIEATQQRLETLERLSADVADGEIQDQEQEVEQLRLILQDLKEDADVVVREGLSFSYPDSTAIIPDPDIRQLRGFVGAGWVAEEYFLTADRIKTVYNVDVTTASSGADSDDAPSRIYERARHNQFEQADRGYDPKKNNYFCVWEIYNRDDGMVYTICDGYPDFLTEPSAPDVELERFYPWFPFVVNEVYDDDTVIPPSDVRLMRDMQSELNRSRQGLREHRVAARPKTFARKGLFTENDKENMSTAKAHEVIELDSIAPNEKIQDLLQAHSGPGIDPSLYDPSPVFEDYLRSLGQQEANLGGTSGATATEASIAEGSRATGISSTVDDLDEFLTELARASGQVLLLECSPETVKEVVGPGAVWPEMDRKTVAREIFLEVEAASTGRPNKAAEVQNAQAIFPLLMQVPGISPEWMGRELIRRMDDRLDLTDAFASGLPSIQMLNSAQSAAPGGPGGPGGPGSTPDENAPGPDNPDAQGGQGASNAPSTQPPQVNEAPRPPQPGMNPGMPTG